MGRRKKRLPADPVEAVVDDLSHDGRGVARVDGKAVFIDGALPGERVRFVYRGRRRDFDWGTVEEVLEPSPYRVVPRCPHAGVCGGCSLQHADPVAQIRHKRNTLLENLRRIGDVEPEHVLPDLTAGSWGYRRRARLSVKFVEKKGRVLVGFREKQGRFVADSQECHVLVPQVGLRIAELGAMLDKLDAKREIPQIEIAAGDRETVLVLRHLQPLGEADRERLRCFEERTGLRFVLQPGGPDSLEPLTGTLPELTTQVPPGIDLRFTATNFVQVNASLNSAMVDLAIDKLALSDESAVLDLFCGLGNFTLPVAKHAARVLGIEGDDELVGLARDNAARNGIENARFQVADLTEDHAFGDFDRVLLDPPRSGAAAALQAIADTGAERVVYVSCHPGTLARDAGELVRTHGFTLLEAGVMDMFPHTGHVESIAVFTR
ncbi:MAG: 23S rRNA (uracil(1939)-C(5))-methyltransferase RlmD [Xanthomonadales bacterium]|nr:23S rRNA (uracil(1939)-C(5))-methyltransferase RlmD [Xanthomonadales bacterium]